MNSIKVDNLGLFYGKPLLVNDICVVYPPTLGDIAQIGVQPFYNYIGLLTMDKKELFESSNEATEIAYLLATATLNVDFYDLIKEAFLFFIKEEITLLPELEAIQIGKLEEKRLLLEDDFIIFQDYVRKVCALEIGKTDKASDSERVKEIKNKIRQGQALVDKLKRKEIGDEPPELFDIISSYLSKATEVDIKTIWDMPYYMFQIQFRRMQMIEEYDINLRSALAGAKIPKEKMKHWIRKIQET